MKKFIFRLESVHRHRQWLEEEAKRELGRETHKLNKLLAELDELKWEQQRLLDARRSNSNMLPAIQMHYIQYCAKLSFDMEKQCEKISCQEKTVRNKNDALKQAMVERKKMDKLQERALGKYKIAAKRKETALSDETAGTFVKRTNPRF